MDREHRPPGVRTDRAGGGNGGRRDRERQTLTDTPQTRERAARDDSLDTEEAIAERVTAIIVHYGDPALTWRAVASIANSPPDAELVPRIIVVDNHPERRLGERPRTLRESAYGGTIEVVESERNLGFGGGVNLGLTRIDDETEEFVFVLNNDAQLRPRALRRLVVAARRHSEYLLYAPLILVAPDLEDEREVIWAAGGVVDLRRARACNFLHGAWLNDAESALARECRIFVSGCAFLGRSRALLQAGGFDEGFFLYYEDVDLCLRLFERYMVEPCLFVPKAVVDHDVSRGLDFSPMQFYYNWRNRGWVVRRHSRGFDSVRALVYLLLAGGAHAARALLGLRPSQSWAIISGAFSGVFGAADPVGDKLLR